MEQQTKKKEIEILTTKEQPMTDQMFSRFFLSSMVALLFSLIALSSTTYAWYAASISSSDTLTAAHYNIAVSVAESDAELVAEADGSYRLIAGESYTITIEKSEYATAENGYSVILLDAETYYTEQIDDTAIVFTIAPAEDATVFFIPHMGVSDATEKIASGDILIPYNLKKS